MTDMLGREKGRKQLEREGSLGLFALGVFWRERRLVSLLLAATGNPFVSAYKGVVERYYEEF